MSDDNVIDITLHLPPSKNDIFRIELTPEHSKRFDELKARLGLSTDKEVFARALTITNTLASVIAQGSKVVVVRSDSSAVDVSPLFR